MPQTPHLIEPNIRRSATFFSPVMPSTTDDNNIVNRQTNESAESNQMRRGGQRMLIGLDYLYLND
jgi:hypothetical protein